MVLNSDVAIDATDGWNPAIVNEGGPLEICAGDYELKANAWSNYAIDSYNDITISSGTVTLAVDEYSSCIYVSGNLTVDNAIFNVYSGGIDVYSRWDDELGDLVGGDMYVSNSTIRVDATYDYQTGIYLENRLEVSASTLNIDAFSAAIYTNFAAIITNSTVSAIGGEYGIIAHAWMEVYNSNISASGTNGAIVSGTSYEGADYVYTDAIYLEDCTITSPADAGIGMYENSNEWGDTVHLMTVVDTDGNMANDVVIKAHKAIEYNIINGKLIITVTTDEGFNRVALYNENNVCIETINSYTVDGDKYIWTLKINAPTVETNYIVKARDAATNSYKNGITFNAFTVVPEVVIESVESEIRGNRVYVTVTTVSENYDRVAVYNTSTGKSVKYTRNYKEVDDKYVWTLVFDYDENTSNYIVRARDVRTGVYNRVQQVELIIAAKVEPIIDVTITDYDEENILITITTIPDLYRVKVAFADAPTACIDYARDPETMGADSWTWEIVIARPTEATEYAIDVAYVKSIYARYFTYAVYAA